METLLTSFNWQMVTALCSIFGLVAAILGFFVRAVIGTEFTKMREVLDEKYTMSGGSKITGREIEDRLGKGEHRLDSLEKHVWKTQEES